MVDNLFSASIGSDRINPSGTERTPSPLLTCCCQIGHGCLFDHNKVLLDTNSIKVSLMSVIIIHSAAQRFSRIDIDASDSIIPHVAIIISIRYVMCIFVLSLAALHLRFPLWHFYIDVAVHHVWHVYLVEANFSLAKPNAMQWTYFSCITGLAENTGGSSAATKQARHTTTAER